jgi:hypothetical protein
VIELGTEHEQSLAVRRELNVRRRLVERFGPEDQLAGRNRPKPQPAIAPHRGKLILSGMKGGVGDRLLVMRDHGREPRAHGDDRGDAESIHSGAFGWIGGQRQRLGEPEERPEVVAFLQEVDAVEDVQASDLPEILGGVLPGLL